MMDKNLLLERLSKENIKIISNFCNFCFKKLNIKKACKVIMTSSPTSKSSFAYYDPNNKLLKVCYKNRNLADILRSTAHEIMHYKQDLENVLTSDSGKTGSKHENQANSFSGIMMRKYGKMHPDTLITFINEANMGVQSNTNYREYTEIIKKGWVELLKKLKPTNSPLLDIYPNYNSILDGDEKIIKKIKDSKGKEKTIKFELSLSITDDKLNDDTFLTAQFFIKTNTFRLNILQYKPEIKNNPMTAQDKYTSKYMKFLTKTPNDIINSSRFISLCDHEASHYFNKIENKIKLNGKFSSDDNWTNDDYYKYLSSPEEIIAFTSQIISEIKNTKESDLSTFLWKSSTWDAYERYVFNKNPKLKSKMLSKITFAWNKLKYKLDTNEKINDFISKMIYEIKNYSGKSFKEFLKTNSIWNMYENYIFIDNPKLRKKLLSKIAFEWDKLKTNKT